MAEYKRDEWLGILRERFGESPADWAFRCPSCGDVATGADFRAALAERPRTRRGEKVIASDILGQECIGRTLGALDVKVGVEQWEGRGCDWCAYGLLGGPDHVTTEDGRVLSCFPIADKAEE